MPRDYRHPTTITTLRLVFPSSPYPLGGTLWEVLRLSLGGPLWEVGGRLLFGLVRSPRPSSLAWEMFPEEQDFL